MVDEVLLVVVVLDVVDVLVDVVVVAAGQNELQSKEYTSPSIVTAPEFSNMNLDYLLLDSNIKD